MFLDFLYVKLFLITFYNQFALQSDSAHPRAAANAVFLREVNMAYKIDAGTCVNCGTCEPDCPVGAISENDNHREIDASKCVSCGTCASVCPASAISEE